MSSLFKRYESPLHVIEPFLDGKRIEDISVKEIRKRVLLELHLSNGDFYQFSDKEYSKQDILELFDILEKQDISGHIKVWENKELLNFLEKSELPNSFIYENFDLFFSEDFRFIEGGLAYAISAMSQVNVRDNKFKYISKVVEYSNFSNKEFARQSLQNIESFYNQFIAEAGGSKSQMFRVSKRGQFSYLVAPNYIQLLNALPKEYDDLRSRVAVDIVEFTLAHQTVDLCFCLEVLKFAVHLNCDIEIKQFLKNSFKVFSKKYDKESHQSQKQIGSVFYILTVVALACIVLAILSSIYLVDRTPPVDRVEVVGVDVGDLILLNDDLKEYQKKVFEMYTKCMLMDKDSMTIDSVFNFCDAIYITDTLSVATKIFIVNNTDFQCLFVFKDDIGIQHRLVGVEDSISLNKNGNVEFFFYFGNEWTNVEHLGLFILSQNTLVNLGVNGCYLNNNINTGLFLDSLYEAKGIKKRKSSLFEFDLRIELDKSNDGFVEVKRSVLFLDE